MTHPMRNLKMIIAYDGTRFVGFQRQRVGLLTIQGVLEEGIGRITGEVIKIQGAGRTDSGVHANGQVIHFFTASKIPVERMLKAINSVLPEDILVKSAIEAPLDFHAQHRACSKTYSYRIHHHPLRPLFERNFVYHYKPRLDVAMMQAATEFLVGEQDFRSVQAAGSTLVKTTIRTINFCRLQQYGAEIRLEVNANGFLYHMVRNIVGSLLLVGNGKLDLVGFRQMIAAGDRHAAGPTVPAQGLCLERVFYPGEE